MSRIRPLHWKQLVCIFEHDGFTFTKRSRGGTSHWVGQKPGVARPVIVPEYDEVGSTSSAATCGPQACRVSGSLSFWRGAETTLAMLEIPRYGYRVLWSADDSEYVATCIEIPGLSGVAPTEAGAIDELKVAIGGWLEHLSEQGLPWPEPNPAAFTDADPVTH